MNEPLPRWVRVVTVAAVALVAAVAAVASYVHMQTLASRSGEAWRALLLPLSVDGMLVAASMVIFVRRRAGLSPGRLPALGLVAGILASLGANVAAGHPEWDSPWLAGVIAAWPPVALAISFDLLILVHRDHAATPHKQPSPAWLTPLAQVAAPTPEAGEPQVNDVAEQVDKVAELLAEGAGRRRLVKEAGLTEWQAKQRLRAARGGDVEEVDA